jgi:hypothetical protein
MIPYKITNQRMEEVHHSNYILYVVHIHTGPMVDNL